MRIKILNSNLDCLTMAETLAQIEQQIENGNEPMQHVVINASKINLMYKDKNLTDIVNSSKLINADGQSIVWAAKFLGYNVPQRVTGIDLFEELMSICCKNNYSPYFLGAKEEVVNTVVKQYQEKYPDLRIAGWRNGYFKNEESDSIVREIAASNADILFVAFSSPQKEFWINEHLEDLNVPFCMGVGGSFDVISGEITRAPEWMQKNGLEWFHRFAKEPRRMFKRYIIGNLSFVVKVIKEKNGYGI